MARSDLSLLRNSTINVLQTEKCYCELRVVKNHNLPRRAFLRLFSAGATAAMGIPPLVKAELSSGEEQHFSDSGLKPEVLRFTAFKTGLTPSAIEKEARSAEVDPGLRRTPPQELAERMVKIALAYAEENVSRDSAPKTVSKFLSLLGFALRYPDTNEYVPYCAAGLTFAACQAYYEVNKLKYDTERPSVAFRHIFPLLREHYFFPSAKVRMIMDEANARGKWLDSTTEPKKGWPVVFSWAGNGNPDHIGIFVESQPDGLHTVEFNTSPGRGNQSNGGAVATRVRKRKDVLGFVKLYP